MNARTANEFVILEFVSYATLPFTTEIYAENLTIDWGDGNSISYDPSATYFKITYSYAMEETRRICFKGTRIYSLKLNNLGLTYLSLKNCSSLEYLHCGGNELTELDISDCPYLEELHCNSNNLTEFQVPDSNRLVYLNLSYNPFSILELQHGHFLQNLYCTHCRLYQLDISPCTALNHLDISHNFLGTEVLNRLLSALPEKIPGEYATFYPAGNPGNNAAFQKRMHRRGWY